MVDWYFTNSLASSYHLMAILPIKQIKPIKEFTDLTDIGKLRPLLTEVLHVTGVYCIVNQINGKQYIGSSTNLYRRLLDHLKGRSSNRALQAAIAKYGLSNFKIVIYYIETDTNTILTDIETEFLDSFDFDTLYNFKKTANSLLGYHHTKEALAKMKKRFVNKANHPMFGKHHTDLSKSLISKTGSANPMFGKHHTAKTRSLISKMQCEVNDL